MKRLLLSILFFLGLTFLFSASAQAQPTACSSSNPCPGGQSCEYNPNYGYPTCQASQTSAWDSACVTDGVATLQGFGCIFQNILRLIVPLLGLALFVLLLAGGFQYMTAGGDPKQTQKAAGTLTSAIIGIVVVVGVWFIFQILKALTGLDLLQFAIPG